NVARLIEAQQQVNKRLDQMDSKFEQSSRSAGRFEGALNKVGVAIAAAFTIDAAKKLIAIGDEMVTLQARIARLSPSIDVAKETLASLSAIAAQTGNSLSETERLWESLTTALKETGATNSQILMLTSTLQKIGTIGGSSTEEMANALRQFGQSISGGIVRADEFNSILEQMPELARQIAAGLGIPFGDLRKRMLEGKLTAQDALNAIQRQSQSVNEEFDKMPVSIDRAKNSLDVAFKNAINDLNQAIGLTTTLAGLMQSVADNLNYYNNNVGDSSRMPKLIKLQQDLNNELKDGQRWYETDSVFQARRAQAAVQLKQIEGEIAHIRAKAQKDAGSNQFNAPPTKGDDAATKKLVQNSERRLALAKLEGEARARLQAQYDAADAGVTDPKRIKVLQDEYAETYRVTEARKESDKAGKQSASTAESIAQKLESLRQESELAADSTEGLTREQQLLRAEQSLGAHATDEQKKKARDYKAAALDAAAAAKGVSEALRSMPEQAENKSYADSMQNLKAALNAGKIDLQEYNAATEKMALDHQNNLAKINAQKTLNPVATARAEVDPVQQLVNENNQKLALMQQYQQQEQAILKQSYQQGKISYDQFIAAKSATDTQYLALRTAQENQFNEQMTAAQWQLLSQQGLGWQTLTSAVDAFSGSASNAITGMLTGSMSASEAMKSLGSTILNSVVNSLVQAAIQAAIVKPLLEAFGLSAESTLGASTASAAESYAAWAPAAIAASIATLGSAAGVGFAAYSGATLAGKALGGRKNGGPVSSGNIYPVGEGNLPELMQTSKGLFMIPGDGGKVFSNKDVTSGAPSIKKASTGSEYLSNSSSNSAPSNAGGGSGMQVNIQFFDQASGGNRTLQAEASIANGIAEIKAYLLDDQANNGVITQGYAAAMGQRVVARGAY
ncbi:TPA: tape measure protein, partial [Klebsiella pneumoniae]|nr:tape measure protein [Klebsiella pneumoniae]